MKLALFGGTFNPIHLGHLLVAESSCDYFHLDRVIFLPTGHPPHKKAPHTSAKHRLAMVRRAIRGNPRFAVSDWEIRQSRTVYTYQALEHFSARYPKDELHFIVGSDSLRALRRWRHADQLIKNAKFLVVERPDQLFRTIPKALRRAAQAVPAHPVPFSSHEVRRRVRTGRSIRYHVPDAVARYIQEHRLYRTSPA